MSDEYDKEFEEWYKTIGSFDVESMPLHDALRMAYFAGSAMGTQECIDMLKKNRQAG